MLIRRKARSPRPFRRNSKRPKIEPLEDRTLLSAAFWSGYGGNAQHTALSTVAAQPLDSIVWQTPVDLNPQYDSSGELLIHYGEPAVTQNNTLIVPVKTGATGGFQLEAINGYTGVLNWTLPTDYILPSANWTPSFGPVMAPSGRVYFAGAGGTVYYADNPDSTTAPTVHQLAFYGLSNYQSNPTGFNSSVFIDTPLTSDANGNIFFGFRVQGTAPGPINSTQSGYARIDANGNATYVLVGSMTGDSNITLDSHNAAPAISNDGSTIYVLAKSTSQFYGYLVALNATTLATQSKVFLADPRNGAGAGILDDGTSSPMVAPDGTVFVGVMGDPYNGSRGFMLHYSANLSTEYTPGAFGWDDTASIVPTSMVPGYAGTSSYLIFTKYNNYAADSGVGPTGSNGINEIAVLDPYASQPDQRNDAIPPNGTNDLSLSVMKEVLTIVGPTPDAGEIANGFPNAVREWCINSCVVDPGSDSVYAGSEDGKLYRWNLATDTLSQVVTLSTGLGEAYTPTWMGPDGKVYAINNAILFAVGGAWDNFGGNGQHTEIGTVAAQPIDSIHWQANVDLNPTAGLAVHYGEPVFTPGNTVIVPVLTGGSGGFELQGYNGRTGSLLWTVATDYQEPPYTWLPPFQAVVSSANDRVYFAGDGGTVYYINNPDSAGATISGQIAFYGTSNYTANAAAYNGSVEIDTPLTVDAAGNVYFGFMVTGTNPSGLIGGGIARVGADGSGTYALASTAAGDPAITRTALGSAPALSNDDSTVYVAVNNTGQTYAYLLGLNSTTLATVDKVFLKDPRNNNATDAEVVNESTAAPMVAPDGTVYFGVFGDPYNGSRGFLLHFSGDLTQEFTPGAFGWDDTPSIVPASMVPSYHGTSSYLILSKYNNYVSAETGSSGGNGVNEIAILDPNATELDPNNDSDPSLLVMNQVLTITSPTPDTQYTTTGFPDATREWCTNGTAVDPFTDSVFINNEDGYAYRWNLATDTLSQAVQISPGIGEPYTPTAIGPDGTVYAINGGTLFALGGMPNYTLTNVSSSSPSQYGQSVTFTTTLASTSAGATPTGTVSYFDGTTLLGTITLSNGVANFATSTLSVAHHEIEAVYSGDGNYVTGSTTVVQPVLDETTTAVTSSANPSVFGQSVTLTATVSPSNATSLLPLGTVTFLDGTTVLGTAALNASDQAMWSTSALTGGIQSITAVYGGDQNFVGDTSSTFSQTISPAATNSTITTSLNTTVYGQSVTFTATVASVPVLATPATGTIDFFDGATELGTATVSGNSAAFTTSALVAGSHTITATYEGDANYATSTSTGLTQTVNQDATTTTVLSLSNPSVSGQSVTFTASVSANSPGSGTPTGTVTFLDGTTTLGSRTLSGGSASFTITSLSVGSHSITVSYGSDSSFTASSSTAVTQTVNQDTTTATVASSANPSVFGQNITFTATVSANSPGTGTPTGTVTFLDGTTTLGTATLSSGSATFSTAALTPGSHSITVSYGSDSNFSASSSSAVTQTVNRDATTTTVASSHNPSVFGQSVTFTATVSANSPGSGTPTGTVTFLDGATTLGTATLGSGSATFTTSALSVGSHSITVSYGSDTNFSASNSSALTQTVNQDTTTATVASSINPTVHGQSVTFTATVSANSPGSGTPTGTVTFLDGTTTLGTAALSSGSATFSTAALTSGSHSITVNYGSDSNFSASSSSAVAQTVNRDATTTTVASSHNPSVFGQSVTFTATVSANSPGSGTPTGTVTFLDGATTLGTATLGSGSATFTTSALSVGSHSITVSYGSDTNFSASNSSALTQTVNQDTTTATVASSINPTVHGQSVTFTATVSANSPGSGTPTGIVTFLDGTTTLGTTTLGSGSATFSTSTLAAGSHSITVSYGSDANFSGSTSAVVTQTVNQDATTASVVSSVNPSVAGQNVTFTATVVAQSPGGGTPTGTVTFLDGSTTLGTATLSAGTATFGTSSLTVASHSITVSYGGESNFTGSSSGTVTQTVNKDATTTGVSSSANPSATGQSVTFTATVSANSPGSGTPTGTVTFLDGSTTLGTGTLSGGIATFSTSTLSVGSHSITASYDGSSPNFLASTSTLLNQTVSSSGGTTTILSASVNPSVYMQSVTFSVTVQPSSGPGTPTGSVTFLDGTTTIGTATLSGGMGSFTTQTLSVGSHSITANYGGGGSFTASTSNVVIQAVNQDPTASSVAGAPNPAVFGQAVTLTATVASTAPGSGIPTGTVQFLDGSTSLGSATLNNGHASFTTSAFSVGSHSITVSYSGDTNYTASLSPGMTQTINRDTTTAQVLSSNNPSMPGQNVTFTATISASSPGSGTPSGQVAFLDGTTTLGIVTLSGGSATFNTSSLAAGNHSITVSYGGDASFTGSTSSVLTQSVGQVLSVTTLTSSSNPGFTGFPVTFTATVTPQPPAGGTPTGTVAFKIRNATVAVVTLNSQGVATFSTSFSTIGTYAISANYSGDASFSASSATVNEKVNRGVGGPGAKASLIAWMASLGSPTVVRALPPSLTGAHLVLPVLASTTFGQTGGVSRPPGTSVVSDAASFNAGFVTGTLKEADIATLDWLFAILGEEGLESKPT